MEIEKFEAACIIYDTIQAIERTQSVATNILNLLEKVDLKTLVDEMNYDLPNSDIRIKVETEAKNAIKEELKKWLVSLDTEKSIKESELERL